MQTCPRISGDLLSSSKPKRPASGGAWGPSKIFRVRICLLKEGSKKHSKARKTGRNLKENVINKKAREKQMQAMCFWSVMDTFGCRK